MLIKKHYSISVVELIISYSVYFTNIREVHGTQVN